MANQEQLDIIRQGVKVWNAWRGEHGEIRIDLSNADLSKADLREANLIEANLCNANLREANLSGAFLFQTNLSGTDLFQAHLIVAILIEANLKEASLAYANFNGTYLDRTNLSNAIVGRTTFADVDLRSAKGLDTVKHESPSTIGTDTLLLSQGDIPEVFLRGAGLDDTFISYVRSLVQNPIQYYTCFISYSSKDQDFAERLHADLQRKNVRCWFAPEDLKIGEKFWHRIDESIRLHDKLLVVLSQHSVESEWVEREVVAALEKEQQQHKVVLFPITLDGAFKNTFASWAADLRRQRHIGDFQLWKDHDSYQKSLNRLLRDLKAGVG